MNEIDDTVKFMKQQTKDLSDTIVELVSDKHSRNAAQQGMILKRVHETTQGPQSDPRIKHDQNDIVGNRRENDESLTNGKKTEKQCSCPVSSNWQRKTLDRGGKIRIKQEKSAY